MQALLAARELPKLENENEIPWWWKFRDILACLSQWAVMLAILTLHTYLTFFIAVPGKFLTVLKFHDFPIIQILCEMNFGESRNSETAVFAFFGALNFVDLVNFSHQKVQTFIIKSKFRTSKCDKMADFALV